MHTIIDDHTTRTYAQVYNDLPVTDADPDRPGYLVDFYSGTSILATNKCGSSCAGGAWNREHTWPQSHGGIGTSGPGADLHHMRPEFGTTNSSRGNKDFDNGGSATVPMCALCRGDGDSFEPRDATKGDVARGVLYMAVRYEGDNGEKDLKMNDSTCNESGPANLGKLSTLVAWSLADPPDDRERARNDLIDSDYQHNRNPFVDHPEWVTSIFGNGVGLGPACGSTTGSDYVPGGGTAPTNIAPTASTPPAATSAEDTTATVTFSATDADNDPLTWTIAQAPTGWSAAMNGPTLTYTPPADVSGTGQVTVRVSDGRGGTATATVTINVTPVNDAPRAGNLAATTPRGTSTDLTLAGTDVDNDNDTLTYDITAQPANGTVTLSGAVATYTPLAGFTGPDSFTYTASDAAATSAPATVSISVTTVQQPVTATDTSASTDEDTPVSFPLVGSGPEGATLTYAVQSGPTRGRVTLDGAIATYTPRTDLFGGDTFTYTVSDGRTTSTATARLRVRPVNDAPVASAPTLTTAEDSSATVVLSGSDAEGSPLTYALATPPAHGSVTLAGTTATYTPAADYNGSDAFTWTVSDGTDTTTGSVAVTVTPVNDAPTAAPVAADTTRDTAVALPLAGQDVDGDVLTYTVSDADHGTVTVDGLTATYTPDAGFTGQDTFTYTATDGALSSSSQTVTVQVAPRTVTLVLSTTPATRGSAATTTITATGSDGTTPTGAVRLRTTGRTLGTPVLGDDGTADVRWVPTRAGATSLVADYLDDDRFEPTTTPITRIGVARTRPTLGFTSGTLRRGRAGVLKVSVRTVAGAHATGKVTLRVAGRSTTASLVKGVATVTVARLPQVSRLAVSARYTGDTQYATGSATHTYAVGR